uniref:Uncharacterized protein n=1 Tax=Arundo donax TaxID=35708 RepID=A0A0A9EPU8_ARUDO
MSTNANQNPWMIFLVRYCGFTRSTG